MGEGLYGPRLLGPGLVERAALDPRRRPAALYRALEAFVNSVPAQGTALIRPSPEGSSPWRAEYAGTREEEMRRWLRDRLDESLEATMLALAEMAPCSPDARPLMFPLYPRTSPAGGLWVVWPYANLEPPGEETGGFREALETLVEVENEERLHFRGGADLPELAQALRQGDDGALPALLDLTRRIGGADLAYWGSVHDETVNVEWHRGALDGGFGFELPLGQGVGGRAFAGDETFEIVDYRNCQYRYPGVSDVTDGEEVRSTLAIPVHSEAPQAGAVLYAGRRTVAPFSPAQRLLLSRLARSVEPVSALWSAPRHFFIRDTDRTKDLKCGLRSILLHSSQVQDIESWAERLVRGPAVMVGPGGHPYVLGNLDRLERLRNSPTGDHGPQAVALANSETGGGRGHLYLWPSADLPLSEWPDLLDDLAAACNVVIDRMEHAYDRLNHQRSHWLRSVLEGGLDPQSRREGNRLGLPTDRGEVWAVAWEKQAGSDGNQLRLKMLAEDVVLDLQDSPFIVLDDDIGVLLLKDHTRKNPSHLRDELLKIFGPAPLWLVHGARYNSFEGLENALLQSVKAIRRVRQEDDESYISEVNGEGLDSLLENPRLSEDLFAFADSLLAPVLAYDEEHGTQLAETLCLSLLLDSTEEVSRRLYVHANTVRYRTRRAEEILDRDLTLPKERVAANLAAFVWLRRHADDLMTGVREATAP